MPALRRSEHPGTAAQLVWARVYRAGGICTERDLLAARCPQIRALDLRQPPEARQMARNQAGAPLYQFWPDLQQATAFSPPYPPSDGCFAGAPARSPYLPLFPTRMGKDCESDANARRSAGEGRSAVALSLASNFCAEANFGDTLNKSHLGDIVFK